MLISLKSDDRICVLIQAIDTVAVHHDVMIWKFSWWCHQMETFCTLLAIYAGNSPVLGEFPAQRPVTKSFDVFFDLRPNKRLSKQWRGWWFETPSSPLWCHCNVSMLVESPQKGTLMHNFGISFIISLNLEQLQALEQTVTLLMFWDALALMYHQLKFIFQKISTFWLVSFFLLWVYQNS